MCQVWSQTIKIRHQETNRLRRTEWKNGIHDSLCIVQNHPQCISIIRMYAQVMVVVSQLVLLVLIHRSPVSSILSQCL